MAVGQPVTPLDLPTLAPVQWGLDWAWHNLLGHPSATFGYAFNVLIRTPVAVAVVSVVEYLVHRHLMHESKFARWVRSERLRESCKDHLLHHFRWYRWFNDEPDTEGKLFNLHISGASFLFLFVLAISPTIVIDSLTAMLTMLAGLAYFFVFNAVHEEMHVARGRWYTRTWLFEYWELSHFVHHVHPNTNFNVLIPWVDPIVGTRMCPNRADGETMAYAKRLLRLRNRLRETSLDGYVLPAADRRLAWLTGFAGAGVCIVLDDRAALFADCAPAAAFRHTTEGGYVVSPHKTHPLIEIHGQEDPMRAAAAWLGERLTVRKRLGARAWAPELEPLRLTIASGGGQLVLDEAIDLAIETSRRGSAVADKKLNSLADRSRLAPT